jgi:hypothetical protein
LLVAAAVVLMWQALQHLVVVVAVALVVIELQPKHL